MTGVAAGFFREVEELEIAARFIMGRVFPVWSPLELGVGPSLLYTAIANAAGITSRRVEDLVRETGDVGLAAKAALARGTGRQSLSSFLSGEGELSIGEVYQRFERIARASGKGSQALKVKNLQFLFSSATPQEVVYLARLALEEMRIGVGEGIVRDAIAQAFNLDPGLVERAYMLTNDLGIVAETARSEGEEGLKKLGIELFRPVKLMLAQIGSIPEAVAEMGEVAVEWKFDGARVQVHKKGGEVQVYSRRIENITNSLPDIVQTIKREVSAEKVILDGEVVAIGEDGKPRPFQDILKRLRRKYEVTATARSIPLNLHLFDILYLEDENLIDLPLSERRKRLESITLNPEILAPQLVTGQTGEIERVYQEALDAGHEGVMLKNPRSPYTPGRRGKNWLKIKPIMETLDLVVTGGDWGEGRRAHLIGSYQLACLDPTSDRLLAIGKVATGITDDQLAELTQLFKNLILTEEGKKITFEPKIVFEVAYEEIQKSPNYESGYALRFPRLVRIRTDKSPQEADNLDRIEALYNQQKR